MESETKFGKACLVFRNNKFSLRYEGKKLKLGRVLQENVMHLLIQIPVTFVTMFLRHTSNLKIQVVLNRNCGLACPMTAKSPQPLTVQKHFTVTWNRASKQPNWKFSSCQHSCWLSKKKCTPSYEVLTVQEVSARQLQSATNRSTIFVLRFDLVKSRVPNTCVKLHSNFFLYMSDVDYNPN